jgi:hypothetical protein
MDRVVLVGKLLISGIVFIGTFLLSYWLLFVQIFPDAMDWPAAGAASLTALVAATLVWRSLRAQAGGILTTAMIWGAVLGAIAFCGGFFGPMIFAPGANQGPLLGIFNTGPLGFAAGAIGGSIYGIWFRHRGT